MFLNLLLVTFLISVLVSLLVIVFFTRSINKILRRILADETSDDLVKYIRFGMYVVGISSGVRINELEHSIARTSVQGAEGVAPGVCWILEVYRTIISALQGLAGVLFIFFIVVLIAFVVVRIAELRRTNS